LGVISDTRIERNLQNNELLFAEPKSSYRELQLVPKSHFPINLPGGENSEPDEHSLP